MTELECMMDYSLVPYDSVCSWDSVNSWEVSWSSLYINDIQHLSSENIVIDIPEEISWDYTWDESNFYLYINWYNTDTAYIEWIIDKQSYIPTTEDFSNVFSNLGLFGSLLVACLFVILVFYMIKKVFS